MHANTVAVHNELAKSDPDRYWGTFQYDPPETLYGGGFLSFSRISRTMENSADPTT